MISFAKTVYSFSTVTGEYLGEALAFEDPLTPPDATSRHLLPANSTEVAPPATGPHQAAVWSGSAWCVVADWRGWHGYDPDGQPVRVDELGQALDPAWSEDLPAAIALERARAAKVAALRLAADAAITDGFASSALGAPHVYPSATTDQANLVQAATGGGGALWCADADGAWSFLDHTADQSRAALADFVAARTLHQHRLAALTASVALAATADAVAAVAWTATPDSPADAVGVTD